MIVSDKLKERLIKLDDSDLASRLAQCNALYREAVTSSSPTLPLGGYVGKRRVTGHNPLGLRRVEIGYPG